MKVATVAAMDRKELVSRISQRVSHNPNLVDEILDATVDEIYESLKRYESVSIRNFGTFYIRAGRDSQAVFKFNPSQRLRQLLGWSSTYKGS
jgi:DNA-binding protein HU-beta